MKLFSIGDLAFGVAAGIVGALFYVIINNSIDNKYMRFIYVALVMFLIYTLMLPLMRILHFL